MTPRLEDQKLILSALVDLGGWQHTPGIRSQCRARDEKASATYTYHFMNRCLKWMREEGYVLSRKVFWRPQDRNRTLTFGITDKGIARLVNLLEWTEKG